MVAALAAATILADAGHTVKTNNGLITGHPAPNVSGVVDFLGISYAQPLVGASRFQPPKPYSKKASLEATTWVGQCAIRQIIADFRNRACTSRRS